MYCRYRNDKTNLDLFLLRVLKKHAIYLWLIRFYSLVLVILIYSVYQMRLDIFVYK
jgi:hypothetical protein